jgi:hypothetical protein
VKPNVGVLDNEGFRVAPLYEQQVHPGMQAAYPNFAEAQSRIRIDPHGPERGVFEPGSISVEVRTRLAQSGHPEMSAICPLWGGKADMAPKCHFVRF